MANLTFQQLEDLWVSAGGNPTAKAMAAAVALAESGGNPGATGPVGERGLWQIATSHGALSTYDPTGNARAAVQISSNGTNWRPWCTAYTDGLCGTQGGSYAPTGGSPAGRMLTGNGGTFSTNGQTPAGVSSPGGILNTGLSLNPFGAVKDWIQGIFQPILNLALEGGFIVVGFVLISLGVFIFISQTREVQAVIGAVGRI